MKTSDFIKQHPICCFCGGGTPATTVDHQPAKIIFPEKARPRGLEFPACERCNKQTSVDECILAFVARLTGSLRDGCKLDDGLERALQTVSTNCPHLLSSMGAVTFDMGGIKVPALDVNRKEINEGLCRIAAKLAIATYYAETGNIVLPGSRINAIWTHNQRRDTVGDVHDLLARFPRSRELKQGKWDTSDSFFIRYNVAEEDGRLHTQVAAVFHESVALMAQFVDGGDARNWEALAYTFAPDAKDGIKLVSQRWS